MTHGRRSLTRVALVVSAVLALAACSGSGPAEPTPGRSAPTSTVPDPSASAHPTSAPTPSSAHTTSAPTTTSTGSPGSGTVDCTSLAEGVAAATEGFAEPADVEVTIESPDCVGAPAEARSQLTIEIARTTTTAPDDLRAVIDALRTAVENPAVSALGTRIRLSLGSGQLSVHIQSRLLPIPADLAGALAAAADGDNKVVFNVDTRDISSYDQVPADRRRLIAHPAEASAAGDDGARLARAWAAVSGISAAVGWPGEIRVNYANLTRALLPIPGGSSAPDGLVDLGELIADVSADPHAETVQVWPTRDRDGITVQVTIDPLQATDPNLTEAGQRSLDALVAELESWQLGPVEAHVAIMTE